MVSRRGMLGSLVAFTVLESLWSRELLAASGRGLLGPWFTELAARARELRGQQMRDVEFQARLEELLGRVDLAALAELIDFDAVDRRLRSSGRGRVVDAVDLRALPGVPTQAELGRRLFACREGRAIVPHGHVDMCTGFVVLRGRWRGRHYDRVALDSEHCLLRPTIDRSFGPGDCSTISDHRDNVHWFVAETDTAYLFNVHVAGYDPEIRGAPGRFYLDPAGEALPGGTLIRAPRMSSADCHAKYG
jgi:hypothetical protein